MSEQERAGHFQYWKRAVSESERGAYEAMVRYAQQLQADLERQVTRDYLRNALAPNPQAPTDCEIYAQCGIGGKK